MLHPTEIIESFNFRLDEYAKQGRHFYYRETFRRISKKTPFERAIIEDKMFEYDRELFDMIKNTDLSHSKHHKAEERQFAKYVIKKRREGKIWLKPKREKQGFDMDEVYASLCED
jgi:hypothetical protein